MQEEFKSQCYESYNWDKVVDKVISTLYCRAEPKFSA